MAEAVALFLKANGTAINGENTQTSLGRENSIEVLYYEQGVTTAREASSGIASGRRQYLPLLIRKRIDKSTPLIFKALADNQVIEGEFKFFRPNPTGDGTTEQFFSVSIKQGRVASVKQILPDVLSTLTNSEHEKVNTAPPMEEVTFVFHTISQTYTNGGVTHEDSWSQQR